MYVYIYIYIYIYISLNIFKYIYVTSDSHLPKKFVLFASIKMMKNYFYFTLTTLFVLKVLKFLS